MFGTRMYANGTTAPSNALNDEHKRYYRGRNYFNYGRKVYNTLRYADLTPFEAVHGVEGDILQFGSKHNIRSYTLKSPLQSDIFMKKVYTQVDMKAILPKNWDIIYQHPLIGDDVPEDVYTSVKTFSNLLTVFTNTVNSFTSSDTTVQSNFLDFLFKSLLFYEMIFSDGSLLSSLGYHVSSYCKFDNISPLEDSTKSFDYNFQKMFHDFATDGVVFSYRGIDYDSSSYNELFDAVRFDPSFKLTVSSSSEVGYAHVFNSLMEFFGRISFVNQDTSIYLPVNLDVLFAYQISCVNFFSRDEIDNIFTAEKYHQLLKSLVYSYASSQGESTSDLFFEYNGTTLEYDMTSSCVLSFMFYLLSIDWAQDNHLFFSFVYSIFGYQQNLRYGDYFTGSKKSPMAVGDAYAQIEGNYVTAIDTTISLLKARFYNAINRVGRTFSSYLGLMDGKASPKDTEPRWLATINSRVSGFEVENTAEKQGEVVTLLKSSDSKYVYEVEVGSPCIIIGIACFEIERVYSRTIDRFFFHRDRYDMFNKFMQNIGDQAIITGERIASKYTSDEDAFGYTPRHMEYKQRYPIACGGFVQSGPLSSYAFITDNYVSGINNTVYSPQSINSEYIRSSNAELDRFYSSLTGYGLANYFHFIVVFDNRCDAYRKMLKAPSIL